MAPTELSSSVYEQEMLALRHCLRSGDITWICRHLQSSATTERYHFSRRTRTYRNGNYIAWRLSWATSSTYTMYHENGATQQMHSANNHRTNHRIQKRSWNLHTSPKSKPETRSKTKHGRTTRMTNSIKAWSSRYEQERQTNDTRWRTKGYIAETTTENQGFVFQPRNANLLRYESTKTSTQKKPRSRG